MLKLYSTFGLIVTVIEVIIGIAVIINSIVFGCAKGKNSYLCRLAPYEIVFEVLLTVRINLIFFFFKKKIIFYELKIYLFYIMILGVLFFNNFSLCM
jgi:hypothetical protein